MTRQTLQIGVIGTGGMGGRHTRNLAYRVPEAAIMALMDLDQARLESIAAECGTPRLYNDASTLIADPDVEAVLIASPDSTHASFTLECLKAHKPVLCEKPLAVTARDAEAVIQAEVAAGRRLIQVGFMREFDPAHQRVKAILDSGQIGQPLMFLGTHVNQNPVAERAIEDVIINSTIHDFHSARWMMGAEVTSVYVQYVPADSAQPDRCRLANIQMTFQNGGQAVIKYNDASGYGYEVDVEVITESGVVNTNALRSPIVRRGNGAYQAIEADWLGRFDVAYLSEVQAWVKSLIDDKPVGPSAWDGYASLAIAEACLQSARLGSPQAVVSIDRPDFYT